MHVRTVALTNFRRFTNLLIVDLPATTKLVILAGPNGNGKSSLFDAFVKYWERTARVGGSGDQGYYTKISGPAEPETPGIQGQVKAALRQSRGINPSQAEVEFHETAQGDLRKSFYFRSAYRNEPEFTTSTLNRQGPVTHERRFTRFIENDAAVQINYQRLISQSLESVFEGENPSVTIGEFRKKSIGEIQSALRKIFPTLSLDGLGNPMVAGTFRFSKGSASGYSYMNLSGGEKAAFDLILDYVVKKKEFDDTVFCIDEPEAHLNPRVHGALLDVLVDFTGPSSQLWVATHSIGMLRRARDIEAASPGTVAVLDFDVDFDQPQVLRPIRLDRAFWQRSLQVALDDLAALVAPAEIIACESGKKDGTPGEGIDSAIYNAIFESDYPETRFVSIGSSADVKGDRFLVVQAVAGIIEGTEVKRLIDRDGMSDLEVQEHAAKGYRVLRRRHIESYLFDDEVLDLLCENAQMAEKKQELRDAKKEDMKAAQANGHAVDHMKAASGRIADSCRRILRLTNSGRTTGAFMRDTLAPLVQPSTQVYRELREDIFGSPAA